MTTSRCALYEVSGVKTIELLQESRVTGWVGLGFKQAKGA